MWLGLWGTTKRCGALCMHLCILLLFTIFGSCESKTDPCAEPKKALETLEAESKTLKTELSTVKAELTDTKAALRNAVEAKTGVDAALATAKKTQEAAQKTIAELQKNVADLNQKLADVQKAADDAAAKVAAAKKAEDAIIKAAATPEKPSSEVTPDPALLAAFNAMLENCAIDSNSGWVSDCKSKEDKALTDAIDDKPLNTVFDTLSVLLNDSEAIRRTAAAKVFSGIISSSYEVERTRAYKAVKRGQKPFSKDTALRLIHAITKTSFFSNDDVIPGATHAAVLTGTVPTLIAILNTNKRAELAWNYAIPELMVYGRLELFPTVKALSKAAGRDHILNAIKAAGRLPDWSKKEKAVLCPWLGQIVNQSHPKAAQNAGELGVRCGGENIDQVLKKGEALLAKNNWSYQSPFTEVFESLCPRGASDRTATTEQCTRLFTLLDNVAKNTKVRWRERGSAVRYLAAQHPRDLSLVAKLREYEKLEATNVWFYAKRELLSLAKWWKLQDDQPLDDKKYDRPLDWSSSAYPFKDRTGKTIEAVCPPQGEASTVYGGSPTYGSSSSICSAAAHAGRITLENGGKIRFKMKGKGKKLKGSTANGIRSYDQDNSSYGFVFK